MYLNKNIYKNFVLYNTNNYQFSPFPHYFALSYKSSLPQLNSRIYLRGNN